MSHAMQPEILTASGQYFNLINPASNQFDIEEIAHALSHLCRFTGHTRMFYSVAQHSVMVSHLVPPEHALAGLLHDATEAYLGDVAAPLKQMLSDYKALEKQLEKALYKHFHLPAVLPDEVKLADRKALAAEARDLMPPLGSVWHIIEGLNVDDIDPIEAWPPIKAKNIFLERYNSLLLERAYAEFVA